MSDRDLPHVALSIHAHNREGLHRTDEAWLAGRWNDPATQVLVLSGTRVRPVDGRIAWVPPHEAPPGRRILLGQRDDVTRFAVVVERAQAPGSAEEWVPLRAMLPAIASAAADQAPWLFHAVGLAEWHHTTRHCPRCAGSLISAAAGHELRCTECGRSQFPRTDPAVIMAITHPDDDALLLGRQRVWPPGRWSTLAGFCEPGETLEDAVRREVAEETDVRVGDARYFGSQPWPFPCSLMLGFTGVATSREIEVDGAEIEQAQWWTREAFIAAAEAGELEVPRGVSISSSLIEDWLGEPIRHGWGERKSR